MSEKIKQCIVSLSSGQYTVILALVALASFMLSMAISSSAPISAVVALVLEYLAHKLMGRLEFGNWR